MSAGISSIFDFLKQGQNLSILCDEIFCGALSAKFEKLYEKNDGWGGGGHIVFGVDPISLGIRMLHFRALSPEPFDGF